ncbi:MAG: hypothetical protein V3T39_01505 [Gammaproteobacteria bacterium]
MIKEPTLDSQFIEEAANELLDLANKLAEKYPQADVWDIADGFLAGAVDYWLFSRQPCGDLACAECAEVSSAELRMNAMRELTNEVAKESLYFHAPTDRNVARA